MSTHPVIAVVNTAGVWRVLTPDETFRTFDFKIDAEEAALKLARRARVDGEPVEVLMQGPFGEMRSLRVG